MDEIDAELRRGGSATPKAKKPRLDEVGVKQVETGGGGFMGGAIAESVKDRPAADGLWDGAKRSKQKKSKSYRQSKIKNSNFISTHHTHM